MKYKSIFFAKIAHEFKNPILCIDELANNLEETLIKNKLVETVDPSSNSKIVHSLCNYLIILIKDLDHFSCLHITSQKQIEITPVNIAEVF
jgi:signal transduction histidine kinase